MYNRLRITVLSLMLALVITGCEQQTTLSNPHQSAPENQTGLPIGSGQNDDVLDDLQVNNPNFGQKFLPFHSNSSLMATHGNEMDEEAIWDWILAAEDIYQTGVFSQFSYSDEQYEILSEWLSGYLDDEIKQERLNSALKKVDGGYNLVDPAGFRDFSFNSVQEVLNLTLKNREESQFTLEANLIVRQDQEVLVSYTFEERDGNWILVDYHFELV